ncbi:MAG: transcriptional repressor [Candidatus Gracilibacteria bacterium]|nr:transcriptional repressor [Candidatus Gracilibacteria bacterium]
MENFSTRAQVAFADRGWRFTAGTRNLARVLEETDVPLPVRDISAALEDAGRGIDTATVYRLLERFLETRLIHRVAGGFFPCANPENGSDSHHFLVCEKCARAEEIFLDYKDSISKQLEKEKGFLLREVDLTFFGACKHCR